MTILPPSHLSHYSGFILTRRRQEVSGKIHLEYWLSTHAGPLKLITPVQRDVFFVRQDDLDHIHTVLAANHLYYDIKELALTTFKHEAIAALYFTHSHGFFKAREYLKKHNITSYENDIRIADRFLMERFIYGAAEFTGTLQTTSKHRYPEIHNAQLKPAHHTPRFKVLSLDIECSEKGELYSIGLAADDFQRVLMIGTAQANTPSWVHWCHDEKALLRRLIVTIEDYDPDIFIGWNVVNFDFRLLLQRAEYHNIRLTLGRDNETIGWRNATGEVNQGFVYMNGRVVIDGIDALKTATYHFASFSLEFVAQELLGKGKLTEDPDNRMAAITQDFQHNKIKLAEYNLQDCLLVLEVFEKTKLLDFLTLRSQLTGLELNKVGGSVAAFLNLYLPKLHRAGYVSPNRPINGGLASPGGYVMDSMPGLYRHVLVLDFKSLYPSIIRTFKVDPVGLIEGLKQSEFAIPGYKGALFSRQTHFLPDIITSLWLQRDEAKKNNDTARSQAIKILMNSFYGVLGSGGCPLYDTRLASSITMRGHDIMQTTARWIEDAGYTVIYGDTDSTFVWLDGDFSTEQATQIGKALQDTINKKWNKKIQDEFQLDNHLEIEFETYFSRFLMPTIRGSALGSKKRYAGLKETFHENTTHNELIFKGLETVRSDWTPLAKRFQYELYTKVFAEQNIRDYIIRTIADTRAGCFNHELTYRKRLRRRLEHYVKNVPPHVKAARQADTHNASQKKPLRYQHKGWISYVLTVNGPEAIEHHYSSIDYDHYIDKQIRPIAEGILPFIGESFEEITSAQLGLFF